MSGLPYYPRYPRDFLEGTAGMRLELKGAYGVIIDLIMMRGDMGLPDDPHFISGQLGCSVRKWNLLRSELLEMGKLTVDLGIISNTRADKEKIIQRSYRDNQAENARGSRNINDLEKPPPPYDKNQSNTDNRKVKKQTKSAGPSAPRISLKRWDDFWAAYPPGNYSANKEACRKKYLKAVKDGATEDQIISAVIAYGKNPNVAAGYVKNPGNWLSDAAWTDVKSSKPAAAKTTQPDDTLLHFEAEREKQNAAKKANRGGGPSYTLGSHNPQAASYV